MSQPQEGSSDFRWPIGSQEEGVGCATLHSPHPRENCEDQICKAYACSSAPQMPKFKN